MSDGPLADVQAFEDRYHGTLEPAERRRASALIDDATNLMRAEFGRTWLTDDGLLEDPVVATICLASARRAFDNPEMITSEQMGIYAVSRTAVSNAVYLTDAEADTLRRVAAAASSGDCAIFPGLSTISATRGPLETPSVLDDCEDRWE